MNTNDLKMFLTYARTQNLRTTAEFHRVSHVAILRALRRLEVDFGMPLTRKTGRSSVLTEVAKDLIPGTKEILEREKSLLELMTAGRPGPRPVTIASFEVFSTHLCPEITRSLGETRNVDWLEKSPGDIEQSIRAKAADFGITYVPIPTSGIEHLRVGTVRMGIFQSAALPFGKRPEVSEIPFVVPIQESLLTPTRARGLDGWPDHRIPRMVRYRVTLMESALRLTAAGMCVGYFPTFIVDRFNQGREKASLVEVVGPKVKDSDQEIYIAKRAEDEESSEVRRVARILRYLR